VLVVVDDILENQDALNNRSVLTSEPGYKDQTYNATSKTASHHSKAEEENEPSSPHDVAISAKISFTCKTVLVDEIDGDES
jgi:hypothetical protein